MIYLYQWKFKPILLFTNLQMELSLTKIMLVMTLAIATLQYDYNTAFGHIYDNKIWNQNGPLSGPGSDPCRGLQYLLFLQHLIDQPGITKIVQIGFGDWEMMQHIILEGKQYLGFEVVKSILRKTEYNTEYRIISGLSQIKESGDLLIVRDVMQHWPSSQIDYFIETILPRFKYALLTNDYTDGSYPDIQPGGYRAINLAKIQSKQIVLQLDYGDGHPTKKSLLYTNPKFQ